MASPVDQLRRALSMVVATGHLIGICLPALRASVSGQRILSWSLGIAFVVGLAAQIGGIRAPILGDVGASGCWPTRSMRSDGRSGPASSSSCSSKIIPR
jgi:hypothetical protein